MARIAIFGAGSIGCWVGGRLATGGTPVTLIGRARIFDELADGLVVRELDGGEHRLATVRVNGAARPREPHVLVGDDPALARDAEVVLVCVKSAQTAEAGQALERVLGPSAIAVSFQNGVRNAEILRAALPGRRVLAAMVPFNVVRSARGRYHRTTAGLLRVEDDPAAAPLLAACLKAHLPIEPRRDMMAVQWAKLVMNLNNAINALSGLPLQAELAQRAYRRCLAAAQRETLELLASSKQPVAKLTALPPRWMPRLLEVPDVVFRRLAPRIVAIDPAARSSMWDDLEAKRPTEIDALQGEVVALAERLGKHAPVNARLAAMVRHAETGGRRDYSGEELAATLGVRL